MKLTKGFSICGHGKCKKQFNNRKAWIKHLKNKHPKYYEVNKSYCQL